MSNEAGVGVVAGDERHVTEANLLRDQQTRLRLRVVVLDIDIEIQQHLRCVQFLRATGAAAVRPPQVQFAGGIPYVKERGAIRLLVGLSTKKHVTTERACRRRIGESRGSFRGPRRRCGESRCRRRKRLDQYVSASPS